MHFDQRFTINSEANYRLESTPMDGEHASFDGFFSKLSDFVPERESNP
jgi:hypothetical protein